MRLWLDVKLNDENTMGLKIHTCFWLQIYVFVASSVKTLSLFVLYFYKNTLVSHASLLPNNENKS